MAELTYDDLRALRQRIENRELTIEQAAEQYSLAELAEALRMTRATLQALVEGWSQAQLMWQPPAAQSDAPADGAADGEDRWSATEAVTHMLVTENWYLLHMGRLVGKREHFETLPRGLGDQADNTVPKAELEARLSAATDRILGDIAAIPADANMSAQRDSTFFGELSLRGWVLLAIIHDLDHTAQIQRLTEQSGFPTS
ncbi:MAG TPA: DinB family protein [Ktedonobacterales bacterium]|nr:DinB family protein [Ktedonobacterales bacterium]